MALFLGSSLQDNDSFSPSDFMPRLSLTLQHPWELVTDENWLHLLLSAIPWVFLDGPEFRPQSHEQKMSGEKSVFEYQHRVGDCYMEMSWEMDCEMSDVFLVLRKNTPGSLSFRSFLGNRIG